MLFCLKMCYSVWSFQTPLHQKRCLFVIVAAKIIFFMQLTKYETDI